MRLSLFKKDDKFYLQIPDELANSLSSAGELELFPLKDGFYLLTAGMSVSAPSISSGTKNQSDRKEKENVPHSMSQSTSPQSAPSPSLTPSERKVLHGLLTIRFENRTPAHVKEVFKPEELAVLKELEKKGFVSVFYGTKYKNTGVYNIDDKIYPLLKAGATGQNQNVSQISSPTSASFHPQAIQRSFMSEILKRGYALVSSNGEAQNISDEMRKLPKGEVIGVKGFDGKFYVATKQYFTKISELIQKNLKGSMTVLAIAAACKTEEDGCRSVLRIMADNGDVLEKKKDSFCLA